MPEPTPSERALRARVAAHTSWANTRDRAGRTKPAREALFARFVAEAGGDPVRAEHLYKAHFARLALRSAQSRRRARQNLDTARTAEAELDALGDGAAS